MYMVTSQHKNPCPWGYEIYNLVDPSLVIITIHFVRLNHAPEERRRFFKKYKKYQNYLPLGWGS